MAVGFVAISINYIVALFPVFNQLRQQVRRMLQVGIHGNNGVAVGGIDTRFKRIILAEVSGKFYIKHMRVDLRLLLYSLQCIITTAIVHKNKLVIVPGTADGFTQLGNKVSYVLLLIVGGYH